MNYNANASIKSNDVTIEMEKGKCDKCGSKKCKGEEKCSPKKEEAKSQETKPACCSKGEAKQCSSKEKKK